VSNCITTDAFNVYEKKRQRMEKIKQMRGINSCSSTAAPTGGLLTADENAFDTGTEFNQQEINITCFKQGAA